MTGELNLLILVIVNLNEVWIMLVKSAYVFTSIGMLAALTACSSTSPQDQLEKRQAKIEEQQVKAMESKLSTIPDWFLNYEAETEQGIYATGSAVSDDVQLSLDDAKTLALNEIASKLSVQLSSQKALTQKKGANKDSANVSSLITDEFINKTNLAGYKIVKREVKQEGKYVRAYVMLFFPNVKAAEVDLGSLAQDHQALIQRITQEQQLNTGKGDNISSKDKSNIAAPSL